jgi:hypothetical protein
MRWELCWPGCLPLVALLAALLARLVALLRPHAIGHREGLQQRLVGDLLLP